MSSLQVSALNVISKFPIETSVRQLILREARPVIVIERLRARFQEISCLLSAYPLSLCLGIFFSSYLIVLVEEVNSSEIGSIGEGKVVREGHANVSRRRS